VRARGIDLGADIDWCDIERESAGVYRFVGCGSVEATKQERGLVLLLQPGVDLYAIETPEEMHPSDIAGQITAVMSGKLKPGAAAARMVQTVRNLLETRALAERIACSLVGAGARVVEPTAAKVRHEIGVRLGAQRGRGPKLTVDQQIAHIIPLAIRGWPKRSNPHLRDAGAAALWALQQAELGEAIRRAPHEAARGFTAPPPGTCGPGDYGPDSFGGSDFG
jgi:hypothetical protein